MKLKRAVIAAKYADVIGSQLYGESNMRKNMSAAIL